MAKAPTTTPATPAATDLPSGGIATHPAADAPVKPPVKSKAAAEPIMITVKILSPVHHDGEEIEVGTELELPLEQAKALVLAGAAGEPDDD